MPTTHLLYLHGFRSSPLSTKAQKMRKRIEPLPRVTWCCPQLSASPKQAVELIERSIAHWPRESMGVVGSSLGGFYAALVAERTACAKAVLLNPVADPARELAGQIGAQTTWQNPDEQFEFRREFIDELRALDTHGFTDPKRYYTLIAKGDELLDWREMRARYPAAHGALLEGSDHALSDFDDQIDDVLAFLDLAA